MKIKIVCWGTEDYILCNAIKRDLYDIENQEIKRGYYLIEGNKVEVVVLEKSISLFSKECLKCCDDTFLVICIRCIDEKNLPFIDQIIRKKRSIIITEDNKLALDKSYSFISDKTSCVHFINEDNMDISSLIYLITDNYNKETFKDDLSKNTILAGIEQTDLTLGNLTTDILKNSTYIKGKKQLQLNIHCDRELEIDEKLCIEDALKEYIDDLSMLIIKQSVKNSKTDRLYFNIVPIL